VTNPTGTTYLQANTSYTWTDGDVYEIVQTDQGEGGALGASFSNLGVDNQPHQVLLNKINYLHAKQLADEANIANLQILTQLITSRVGANGWLKLGAQDINLARIQLTIQWGTISLLAYGRGGSGGQLPATMFFNFPIAFPAAIWVLIPYWQTNSTAPLTNFLTIAAVTPMQLQGNQIAYSLTAAQAQAIIASTVFNTPGITGIGWVALGY
jgi:hypothetical protein